MTPTEETVIVTLQLLKHSQQTAFTDGYVLAMTQAVNVLENEISRVEKEHDMTESKGYRYDLDIRQETLLDMVEAIKKTREQCDGTVFEFRVSNGGGSDSYRGNYRLFCKPASASETTTPVTPHL